LARRPALRRPRPAPKRYATQHSSGNMRGPTHCTIDIEADVSPNACDAPMQSSSSVTFTGALLPAGRGQACEGWSQAQAVPEGGLR
jgi:hypothetical protein